MRLASAVETLGIGLLLAAPAAAGEIHHYASTGKTAQVEALRRGGVSPDKPDEMPPPKAMSTWCERFWTGRR